MPVGLFETIKGSLPIPPPPPNFQRQPLNPRCWCGGFYLSAVSASSVHAEFGSSVHAGPDRLCTRAFFAPDRLYTQCLYTQRGLAAHVSGRAYSVGGVGAVLGVRARAGVTPSPPPPPPHPHPTPPSSAARQRVRLLGGRHLCSVATRW